MQVNNQVPVNQPEVLKTTEPPKKETTLDKMGNAIVENTKEGTFIGDNMLLTGAGALVGTVAAGSAVYKVTDKFPAVEKALQTIFVENGKLVASGAALATSALLAEDALASFKEGDHLKAGLEGAGAAITGLGAVELTGRHFNIPVARQALTKPVEVTAKFVVNNAGGIGGSAMAAGGAYLAKEGFEDFQAGDHLAGGGKMAIGGVAALGGAELIGRNYNIPVLNQLVSKPAQIIGQALQKNAAAIGGTALAGAGVALATSGLEDLKEGESMLGGAKLTGGALATLGGAELLGRNFNIPVLNKALSGPAEWVGNNVKAVTGGVAIAGGGFAIKEGLSELKEGNKWLGAAELAGGAVGVLGGAELIGRNFNIPVLNQALTGPVKFMFTTKGGIGVPGGLIAASGLGAAADGVRRLTTEKGIANDAIGVAEFTAGVAGVTGGASIIGYATGSEKLMKVFPENIDVLGGAALVGGAFALGEHTLDNASENGLNLINTATGTGAALMGLGGAHIVTHKFGLEAANQVFQRGYTGVAAAGLGVATSQLAGEALEAGKDFVKDDSWENAGKAFGLTTATLVAGTGTIGLTGHALGIKALENAGRKMAEKGWEPLAAAGLGLATYKLGQEALNQGKAFVEKPNWANGAAAAGLATASVVTGAGSVGLVGHAFQIPVLETASMKVLNGVKVGAEKTLEYGGKAVEKVFNTAVKHPFVTLGALAVAGGVGYYIYKSNQEEAPTPQTETPAGK